MAKLDEKYIVDDNGKKSAVILSIKDYESLMEDIHGLWVIAERNDSKTINFSDLNKKFK